MSTLASFAGGLAGARILVANDDGINAPGLQVLEEVARSFSDDVWVVAPETEQSATSHSLTMQRPLRLRELGPKRFAVEGTPTDCVLLAVHEILADRRPQLLLSGVNRGGNMGEDVTYSGTVAAAMEGTLLDVPSIAFSLALRDGEEPHWETARRFAGDVVRRLADMAWPEATLMNVNIPNLLPGAVTGIRAAAQGRRKLSNNLVRGTDPRGRAYYWIGGAHQDEPSLPGTDIHVVRQENAVAVTPVHLDLTHVSVLAEMRRRFP
jgi:5'-nucleotidase